MRLERRLGEVGSPGGGDGSETEASVTPPKWAIEEEAGLGRGGSNRGHETVAGVGGRVKGKEEAAVDAVRLVSSQDATTSVATSSSTGAATVL